jgi:hypothetical protein
MNKLIQTIVLTAVVFSPLTLLSLVTSAAAEHGTSHVSTLALSGKKKQNVKNSKGKKTTTPTAGAMEKKPVANDEAPSNQSPATGMPTGDSNPIKTGEPLPKNPASIPGTKSADPAVEKQNSIKVPAGADTPAGNNVPTNIPPTAPGLPSSAPGGVTAPSGLPNK